MPITLGVSLGGGSNGDSGFVYTKTGLMITKVDPLLKE